MLYNVAGYHPMVHGGSRDEIEGKTDPNYLTLVDQKSASILLQWLALRLKEKGFGVKLGKEFFVDSWVKKDRSRERSLIEGQIKMRLKHFDCLLPELGVVKTQKRNVSDLQDLSFPFQPMVEEFFQSFEETSQASSPCLSSSEKYSNSKSVALQQQLLAWSYHKEVGSALRKYLCEDDDQMLKAAIAASLADKDAEKVRRRKEALIQIAATYGYECCDVLGDGNCFFYALSDQLSKLGKKDQDIDPDILRILTAIEIENNKTYYKDFLEEFEQENYALLVAKPGTWVGLIAARAIARIKNIIIAIIPSDGGTPQVIKPRGATEVVVLGNEVDFHFQSLTPKDPISKLIPEIATDPLQIIIDSSPVIDFEHHVILLPKPIQTDDRSLLFLRNIFKANAAENERIQRQQEHDKKWGMVVYNPLRW